MLARAKSQAPTVLIAVAVSLLLGAGGAVAGSLIVTGRNVKNGSLTGADVKNHSLTPTDFRGSVRGATGQRGATGPRGLTGAQGGPGIADITTVTSAKLTVPPGASTYDVITTWRANCPAGYRVIGTGFEGDFGDMWMVKSYDYFVGGFGVNNASINGEFELQATCARLSGATAASGPNRAAKLREYMADLKRVQ